MQSICLAGVVRRRTIDFYNHIPIMSAIGP